MEAAASGVTPPYAGPATAGFAAARGAGRLLPPAAAAARVAVPAAGPASFAVPAVQEKAWKGFVTGSLAAVCAGAVVHPIDTVKVRLQLAGGLDGAKATSSAAEQRVRAGLWSTTTGIVRAEGVRGLYQGISGNVLRQSTLIGSRLGFYDLFKRQFEDADGKISFAGKVCAGLGAGAMGAAVGSPADLVMVRMQADGRLPPAERRNYKHAIDALMRISKEEGVPALWRGVQATVNRAMIVTAAQMSFYDQAKEALIGMGMPDSPTTHTCASLAAGSAAALSSNPFDVAKTRLQNMQARADGTFPYRGTVDCIMQTARAEGPFALYKGLVPTFARQAPLNVVRFVALEQLRKIFSAF